MSYINKYKKILTLLGSILLIVVAFKFSSVGEASGEVEIKLEMDNLINNQIKVHVVGAVVNEGVYELEEGKRVEDAIEMAGGLSEEGNSELLNYARVLKDGEKITVLKKIKLTEDAIENNQSIVTNAEYTLLEKINYMTAEDFETIPGIGTVISGEIIKLRESKGQFSDVEELQEVSGIGQSKLTKIIEFLQ